MAASLKLDKRTNRWTVRLYWNGTQHQRICRTTEKTEAEKTLQHEKDTLYFLRTGRVSIPDGVDQVEWIVSGAIQAAKADGNGCSNSVKNDHGRRKSLRFGDVYQEYLGDQAHKEKTTRDGEEIHVKHLKRILRPRTPLGAIGIDILRDYCSRRETETYRGKVTSHATIKKELVTFRQIWNWARNDGRVKEPCPLLDSNGRWKLNLEKSTEREKFQTWGRSSGGSAEADYHKKRCLSYGAYYSLTKSKSPNY